VGGKEGGREWKRHDGDGLKGGRKEKKRRRKWAAVQVI
jgi:hypothetical protein